MKQKEKTSNMQGYQDVDVSADDLRSAIHHMKKPVPKEYLVCQILVEVLDDGPRILLVPVQVVAVCYQDHTVLANMGDACLGIALCLRLIEPGMLDGHVGRHGSVLVHPLQLDWVAIVDQKVHGGKHPGDDGEPVPNVAAYFLQVRENLLKMHVGKTYSRCMWREHLPA